MYCCTGKLNTFDMKYYVKCITSHFYLKCTAGINKKVNAQIWVWLTSLVEKILLLFHVEIAKQLS